MIHRSLTRGGRALLAAAALAVSPSLSAKDVYKGFLDPALPHHRAILDTLERLKASPNDPALHNDLGCLVSWDGFWRDALREFELAAKLDKNDSKPLFNAGIVQAWRGSWSAARHDFSAAKSREPGNWAAWWMLGLAEEKLGHDEAAVHAYKTSLRVDTSLFQVARNPFAAESRLKARVLLETYEKRAVRAGMPVRQELASPERVAGFFQRVGAPVPLAAAAAPTADEAVTPQTGPVVTNAPAATTPKTGKEAPAPPRFTRQRPPAPEPSAEQAPPPDNLPLQPVTPAPKKRPQPGPGIGGSPQPTPPQPEEL